MSMTLSHMTILIGTVWVAIGAACGADPARMQRWLSAFPRSKWPAWVLSGSDLVWSALLLWHTHLAQFNRLKPLLFILVPVVFILVVRYLDELLAPRALGGLLLLVPAPLLAAAQWHPSPLRFVAIGVAYLMVVKGIVLVLSPYQFRRGVDFWIRGQTGRCRLLGGLALGAGLLLVVLGLTVYSS